LPTADALQRAEREIAQLRGDLRAIGTRVVHDLRTPLGSILTAAEVLQEALAETAPDQADFARSIIDGSGELKKLIQQLSVLARAATEPAARVGLPMELPVGQALTRLSRALAERRATVSEPAAWPEVEGDAEWLDLIWSNLLSNALRHADPPPRIELGWERIGDEFRFWVGDHGPGIEPSKRPLLFQPFHLLHQRNSARGLGLAIVQRLVELQGGRCAYAPRDGGGSTFAFFLPAVGAPPPAPASHPTPPTPA
jgi:signal transduction histidine kinase